MKCNLSVLRLTPLLTLMSLPLVITRLLCFHKREHPPSTLTAPLPEAVVLASFPIAWFFGFLYYTEVPSLVSVILTITYATKGKHWLAALVCLHFPLLAILARRQKITGQFRRFELQAVRVGSSKCQHD